MVERNAIGERHDGLRVGVRGPVPTLAGVLRTVDERAAVDPEGAGDFAKHVHCAAREIDIAAAYHGRKLEHRSIQGESPFIVGKILGYYIGCHGQLLPTPAFVS
jgi:hypothetical protein